MCSCGFLLFLGHWWALKLWIYSFHQIWILFGHYAFKFFSCSALLTLRMPITCSQATGSTPQLTETLFINVPRLLSLCFILGSFYYVSCSISFSSALSNLPLILPSVFFISKIIVFISRRFFLKYISHNTIFNMLHLLSSFLSIWNVFV